jgi:hypothetical protein
LVTLLRRKKPAVEDSPPQEAYTQPVLAPAYDRVCLLVPEGAYTYRLTVFPDVKSTAAYVDAHLMPEQSILAFWTSDPDNPKGLSQSGEALVLAAEDGRPDVVRPYSFTDVDAARSFLAGGSASAERPLLFWAEPVVIPRGLTMPPVGTIPDTSQRQAAVNSQPAAAGAAAATAQPPAPAATAVSAPEPEARSPGVMSQVADWPAWEGLGPRMVAASRAKKAIYYDAVDDDPHADGRAALIVILGAFSAGIGALGDGVSSPIWYFACATAGWMLSISAIHLIAVTLLPGKRPTHSYRRLSVAMGLAYSPAVFLMLGAVPIYGPLFTLAVLGWIAVTSVVAIETSLEVDRESALVTAFAGWMCLFAFTLIVPQLIT